MSDLVGQMIGSYRVEALIGTGGMASVYRGVHTLLGRSVALKVPHPHFAIQQSFQDRFEHEAKTIAKLTHPRIVSIFDFGRRDDGTLFLVMELVTGGSIRSLLQSWTSNPGQRSLALGLDLMCQAADALSYAHRNGMIHRDIKPDNMLLSDTHGENGQAPGYAIKLSDFGLVRLAEDAFTTASAHLLGTPAYLAPEQFQGLELDERSDIYSFGVVLYEVATGYLPFEIKTLSEAAYKHTSVEPPLPLMVRPDLPPELGNIILRCLDKRPQNRYPSVAEMLAALQTVSQATGGAAQPVAAPAPQWPGVIDEPRFKQQYASAAPPPAFSPPPAPAPYIPPPAYAPPPPPVTYSGSQGVYNTAQGGYGPPQNGYAPPPNAYGPAPNGYPSQGGYGPAPNLYNSQPLNAYGAPAQTAVLSPAQAPPVGGTTGVPRMHVLDQQGRTYRTMDLSGRGITLGSGNDNDIVLNGHEVSHHHARVDYDGRQALITDLGSQYGTIYRDIPLAPYTARPWETDDAIRLSTYWLRLEPPGLATQAMPAGYSNEMMLAVPEPAPPPPPMPTRIRLVLTEGAQLTIYPGQPGTVHGTIANLGTTVDHFRLTVDGIPPGWVSGIEEEIQLNPGMSAPIEFMVRTEHVPGCLAGEYPVTIYAQSRERPNEIGTADALFTILPFVESALHIEPARVRKRARPSYGVTIRNDGNIATRYTLNGLDEENQLSFSFVPQTIDLDPGTHTTARVTVRGKRQTFGRPVLRSFMVDATSAAASVAPPVRAEWVQPARFPPWTLLIPVFVLLGLLLAWQITAPSIESVTIQPQQPVAGQPVILTWKVHHTTRLDIQPLLKGLDPKTGSHLFPKGLPDNAPVTIVAHGRFFKTAKQELTVAAVQATPVPTAAAQPPDVSIWEVTPQVLTKPGDPVTIKWKVANAESVELLSSAGLDETVELEGQRTVRVTEQVTFTLNAMNKGKSTKRSQTVLLQVPTPTALAPAASRPAGIPVFTATPAAAAPGAAGSPVAPAASGSAAAPGAPAAPGGAVPPAGQAIPVVTAPRPTVKSP